MMILNKLQKTAGAARRNVLFTIGLSILAVLALLAVFAPWITPFPGDALGDMDVLSKLKPPSAEHFFGTDALGRDIFSRVVYATRISLTVGAGIVALSLLIGLPLGLIAGYYGGAVDEWIMRISDGFLAFPPLLLPIAIGGVLGTSLEVNVLAIALSWWPWYVRIVRAQVLVVRQQLYITAARSIGVRDSTIIARHVAPNSANPLIVQLSLDMGYAILMSASLSFVGIGAKPPTAEWGLMISEGRPYLLDYWWITTFPGLAIVLAVIAFNLLGESLRDVLDPKSRTSH